MNKTFQRGLVVGKFSPLHRGHELVIGKALEMCREVVVISYSNPEFTGCEANLREQWLTKLFPATLRLVVTDERLALWGAKEFTNIPPNDAPDEVHRTFVGFLCRGILNTTVDAVFTSEGYGDGFANDLGAYFKMHGLSDGCVRHIMVDQARTRLPISGTELRKDIRQQKQWLSPIVYRSFVKRICLLGGESSGKSTLAESLSKHFGTIHVPEYGRELWERKNGNLAYDDLLHIAEVQVARENEMALTANHFLFCDTSPLTTLFYSLHMFGRADRKLEALASRTYDLVVLCSPDFPFVQDGTRQSDLFRQQQHHWYRAQLAERRISYIIVDGSIEERVLQISNAMQG